jgi:hypothetical protein
VYRNNLIFNISSLCKERNITIKNVKMYCANNFRNIPVSELIKKIKNGYRYASGDDKMDAGISKMDAGASTKGEESIKKRSEIQRKG